MLLTKLENRMIKLRARQLTLAAQITIANTLLLGCIWYLITVWAGQPCFLGKLQRLINIFIWAGRSRVVRGTVALPRAEGGLGLFTCMQPLNAGGGWLTFPE